MLNKSNWKAWIVLGLAVAVLVTSGGLLMASNVGFKINKALTFVSISGSQKAHNWVSLPYNHPYTNVNGICTALVAKGATKATTFVEILNGSTGNVQVGSGNCNLSQTATTSLNGGQVGVRIRMTSTPAIGNIVLVGSSNESLTTPTLFVPPAIAGSQKGHNWISVPYHTTWAKASDVCASIGFPCVGGTPCAAIIALGNQVARIDATTGNTSTFVCGNIATNPANFSLVIGESIRYLRTTCAGGSPTCDIAPFLPPHF
jgi:hypothetical protein